MTNSEPRWHSYWEEDLSPNREAGDFTKGSGQKAPWEDSTQYGEGVLDLISGKGGRIKPHSGAPQPLSEQQRLEKAKRNVSQCVGSLREVPKEQRAEIMQGLKRKLAKASRRSDSHSL